MKRRDANIILMGLAAIGGGVVAYTLPISVFEVALSASGLSETVPAFAPPLGETARQLLTGGSAIMCALLAAIMLPWGGVRPQAEDNHKGNDRMSFFFPGMGWLSRRKQAAARPALSVQDSPELVGAPVLRRSDAHPDAPSRPPLFARRDLGEEALPPVSIFGDRSVELDAPHPVSDDNADQMDLSIPEAADEEASSFQAIPIFGPESVDATKVERTVAQDDLPMPRAPEPLPWHLIEQEMSRILSGGSPKETPQPAADEGAAEEAVVYQQLTSAPSVDPSSDMAFEEAASRIASTHGEPSIQQLVDRLQRGLEKKRRSGSGTGAVSSPSPDPSSASDLPPQTIASLDGESDLQRALAALRSNGIGGR